jgi:hypothetical protein
MGETDIAPETQAKIDAAVASKVVEPRLRTIVDFKNGQRLVRSVQMGYELPSIVLGQTLSFDHPQLGQCLKGVVTNIQHVVFLMEPPLTYVDVQVSGL